MRVFFLYLTILASHNSLHAQWPRQIELSRQIYLHNQANPSAALYLHFDKNIYTNRETVWFTSYLLKSDVKEIDLHHILSVALIRDADSSVIQESKYMIQSGLGFGSMLLPDSMLMGNYHFVATTNRVSNGLPDVMFTQPVVIKTNIDPPFQAGINLLQPGQEGVKPNLVRINVTDKDDHPLKQPVFISYKYGSLAKTEKADQYGQLELSIPEQQGIKDPNLYAKVSSGKDNSFMNLVLPVTKKRATVNFYPEGGYMIEGLPGYIAWEVKDQQNALVKVHAILYRDNDVMDTLETNSYGIGRFMFSPLPGKKYSIRLVHDGFVDSVYILPAPLREGVNIHMAQAAVKDTLQVRFLTNKLQRVAIRIHDFRETYFYTEFDLNMSDKTVRIPIGSLPRGLKSFTVSDSLGRPLNERIFFAKYDPAKRMMVHTDKQEYGRREKVTLHVRLNAGDTMGIASIACVQDNRINSRLHTDIESYMFLKNELNGLPVAIDGNGYDDREYVEDVMMVKGWRKYSWLGIMQTPNKEVVRFYDSLDMKIRVTKDDGKPVKKPIQVGLVAGGSVVTYETDATGVVSLKDRELVTEPWKMVRLMVLDKRKEEFAIETEDPYTRLNRQYVRMLPDDYGEIPTSVKSNRELALKSSEKVRQLKQVEVRAKKDDKNSIMVDNIHNAAAASSFRNECGDYVCEFGVLNCPNHIDLPGKKPAVPGEIYQDPILRQKVKYKSCKDKEDDNYGFQERGNNRFIVGIQGIYTKREFYVDTYSEPLEPAFISTLYWNPGMMLNVKDQTLEFYTGDITGKFRVVVQGVTNSDVAGAEYTFEVKGAP